MTRLAHAALIAGLALLGGTILGQAQGQPEPESKAEAQAQAPQAQAPQTPVSPPSAPLQAQPKAPPQPQAGAAEDSPPPESFRYSFYRLNDTFLRLDQSTGQVAQCGWGPTGWACTVVPDERVALESEIARLQGDNAALKKSLLSRGLELPHGVKPEPLAPVAKAPEKAEPPAEAKPKVPSDAELDRVMAFMEKVWRRLVDMMVSLQRDMQRKG